MTKPTQQQRRENKKQCKQTHNNSDNHESHVSEHEEFVSSNIKYVYPNVNVINMTSAIHSYENVISNVKQLDEYTKDDNHIIIVFNINIDNFTKFHSCYMRLKKVSVATWPTINDNIAVMLIRSNNILVCPKSEINNSDIINNALRSSLKPRVKECLICCHEFDFNEKRVSCCHCRMPMCRECFIIYIKENSGWCPYCTRHIIYYGLDKSFIQDYNIGDLFNKFVGDEMRNCINKGNTVSMISMKHITDKWLSFINGQ